MLQKLTYAGKKSNSYVYFALSSDVDFNPELVTEALELQPTSIKRKADPIPKKASWKLQRTVGASPNLKTASKEIIGLLQPKVEIIKSLRKTYNLNAHLIFKIDIDVHPEVSTPYFPLDVETINFLHRTMTEVDFDIYKVDSRAVHLK